jgi:hypothetical protein
MGGYAKYQIVNVPPNIVKIGQSDYARPFLIYEMGQGVLYAMLISTQIGTYFDDSRDFLILKNEDGFAATGLTASSFVKNLEFAINSSLQLDILGHLSGDILERFLDFGKRHNL